MEHRRALCCAHQRSRGSDADNLQIRQSLYDPTRPTLQRDALQVVFGLTGGTPPDRFLVGRAVLSLFSEAADARPLLCVVDDAQWLDQASAVTLAFVARRLLAERVGIVFAAREPGTELEHVSELKVRGLSNGDARALLRPAVRFIPDEGSSIRRRLPGGLRRTSSAVWTRSAVYGAAAVEDRRAVHLALAEVTDRELDPDRRAWHLAAATVGPDEQVAAELERSAGRAQSRGGAAAAAAFVKRSVALTLDPVLARETYLDAWAAGNALRPSGCRDAARGLPGRPLGSPTDLRSAPERPAAGRTFPASHRRKRRGAQFEPGREHVRRGRD